MAESAQTGAASSGETLHRDIVVVGASAGGVEALESFTAALSPELPASVFVVLHVLAHGTSVLPAILSRTGALPARTPRDGERFERGEVYVAPPDRHLMLDAHRVRLTRGPRENGHRPAVDPLFRSAARHHGRRVIGVVLSGSLDDGAQGLRLVGERGGTTLVQDPAEARYGGMPSNAIAAAGVDLIGSVDQLVERLHVLLEETLPPAPAGFAPDFEEGPSELGVEPVTVAQPAGTPAGLTCPECGGPLWEQQAGDVTVRFECRVGHAFSPQSLVAEQSRALEAALWAALQSMEERVDLLHRIARRSPQSHLPGLEKRAQAAAQHAAVLRDTLGHLSRTEPEEPPSEPEPVR